MKKKSLGHINSDLYTVGGEELWAELTPLEASFLEGGCERGARLVFDAIVILKQEKEVQSLCLFVNGDKIWSTPREGYYLSIIKNGKPVEYNYHDRARVELYANCSNGAQGQKIGEFAVPAASTTIDMSNLPSNSDPSYSVQYTIFETPP